MVPAIRLTQLALRHGLLLAAAAGSAFWSGCSTLATGGSLPLAAIAKFSPAPESATPYQAVENAKAYVNAHPGADYAVGSGDSMLPLYRDRDVIVLEHPDLSTLVAGETVVFLGVNGVPVAHVIVARAADGWVTRGLANPAEDAGVVRTANYIGVVIRAYRPTGSPILAYWATSPDNPLTPRSSAGVRKLASQPSGAFGRTGT